MQFEENETVLLLGERLGFIVGLSVFTTVMFLILTFTGSLPASINYLAILGTVIFLHLIYLGIKRVIGK